MIRKVKFNNFYSFKNTQEICFLAKKKKTYDYFQSKSGDQITKVAGFIGGNASGKTNIMRLFSFLAYFVCASSKNDSLRIASQTFFNNNRPASFSLEFEHDDLIFFYNFTVKDNIVVNEKLAVKALNKGAQKKEVFNRELNVITSNKAFFDASDMTLLKNIRADVSLIAYLKANFSINIIDTVFDYFANWHSNINERGDINRDQYKHKAFELYLSDPDLKATAEKFVCDFDLGLSGFEFEKKTDVIERDDNKVAIKIHGLHKGKQKLDFSYESRGTKQLIYILAGILYAIKHGGVVIADEIETGFHPEAVNKLISYFIDENKEGRAQLIFSSHSLGFMNKLDMHQINLVEKNKEGESFTYRLNQVDNIRTDDNFLSKYLSGSYGAFPDIRV